MQVSLDKAIWTIGLQYRWFWTGPSSSICWFASTKTKSLTVVFSERLLAAMNYFLLGFSVSSYLSTAQNISMGMHGAFWATRQWDAPRVKMLRHWHSPKAIWRCMIEGGRRGQWWDCCFYSTTIVAMLCNSRRAQEKGKRADKSINLGEESLRALLPHGPAPLAQWLIPSSHFLLPYILFFYYCSYPHDQAWWRHGVLQLLLLISLSLCFLAFRLLTFEVFHSLFIHQIYIAIADLCTTHLAL